MLASYKFVCYNEVSVVCLSTCACAKIIVDFYLFAVTNEKVRLAV